MEEGGDMDNKGTFPRIMTVKELSEYLQVHPSTVYKLLRTGNLPAFKVGSDWRFNAQSIDLWCAGQTDSGE
jgi:excisionase family DNA binding protein